MSNCLHCGAKNPESKGNRARKYCSKKCAKKFHHLRSYKRKHEDWGTRTATRAAKKQQELELKRQKLKWYEDNWLTREQLASKLNISPSAASSRARRIPGCEPTIIGTGDYRGRIAFWPPEAVEAMSIQNNKVVIPDGYVDVQGAADIIGITKLSFQSSPYTKKIPRKFVKGYNVSKQSIFRITDLEQVVQDRAKLKEQKEQAKIALEQEKLQKRIAREKLIAENKAKKEAEKIAAQQQRQIEELIKKQKLEERLNKAKNRGVLNELKHQQLISAPKIYANTVKIPLWLNKDTLSGDYAVIDEEDYQKVMDDITTILRDGTKRVNKWYVFGATTGKKYGVSGCKRRSIHRAVMGYPKGMDVDHINGNSLDNRKVNLRVCTRSENAMNKKTRADSRSGYKGVWLSPDGKLIQAYIRPPTMAKGKRISLGQYNTLEEAARVYDANAYHYFGEYAVLNFPNEKINKDLIVRIGDRKPRRSRHEGKQPRSYITNKSGFRGVHFHKHNKRWRAQIGYNYKLITIGYYDTPEEAARAYDAKAKELRGEFARLNFPEE